MRARGSGVPAPRTSRLERRARAGAARRCRLPSLRPPAAPSPRRSSGGAVRGRQRAAASIVIGVDAPPAGRRDPAADVSGSHALIVGATGSGKTVTEALIVARAIERGHGAVIVDPKGDALLREHARARGRGAPAARSCEWTPTGPAAYNPYGHGSPSEIADKALAGERFSEPHYLRQAQRYLAHAVRALAAAGAAATPRAARRADGPAAARAARARDARRGAGAAALRLPRHARRAPARAGSRARATGSRSSASRSSGAGSSRRPGVEEIDLLEAVRERAVVYFRLEADRLPLLARMLAAAIVQRPRDGRRGLPGGAGRRRSSRSTSSRRSRRRRRAAVRARARGGLQPACSRRRSWRTCAPAAPSCSSRCSATSRRSIAHRQSVPDSAELIARIVGTRHGLEHDPAARPRGPDGALHAHPLARVRDPPRRDPHARARHARRSACERRRAAPSRGSFTRTERRQRCTMSDATTAAILSWLAGSARPASTRSRPPAGSARAARARPAGARARRRCARRRACCTARRRCTR